MKQLVRSSLILLAAALFAAAAYSQFTVRGTVVDAESREPVADATVNIGGTGTTATTDDLGAFEITGSSEFSRLVVSRVGYRTLEVEITGRNSPLVVALVPADYTLGAVEVRGWALSRDQLRQARSVGLLSANELQRTSGLSLVQALNTVPGINMQTRTPWGGQRITLRGYYPNVGNSVNFNGLGYQVYLNNVPITDAGGSTIMDDVDAALLGTVEIVKGPAASEYGSPIAGTVDLHVQRPESPGTTVGQQLLGGSYGLFRTNTTLKSSGEHDAYFLNYGHQTYDGFRPHSASKKDYLLLNGDLDASKRQTLSGFFSYSHSYEELAGEIDSAAFYARREVSDSNYIANGAKVQIESFRAGLTSTYRFGPRLTNSTTAFATGNTQNQPFAHGFTDYTRFNFGGRTAFLYSAQAGEVAVSGTLGLAFQRSAVTSNGVFIVPAPPNPQIPSALENYAMNYYPFTDWSFSLPSAVTVSVGASLNFNEFGYRNMLSSQKLYNGSAAAVKSFDAVLTPHASLLKMFGGSLSVYAAVSSGYTPPLLSNIVQSNGTVDTALSPERAVQYEIGSKGNLLDSKLTYQVALFDIEITDKLVSQTLNAVTFTTNAGKQRNRGAEAYLGYAVLADPAEFLSLVRPWISYTYTDAEFVEFRSDNNNTTSTVDYSGKKVPVVAPHTLNAGLDAETSVGVSASLTFRFVDKAPVTIDNNNSMDSYTVVNARAGYRHAISGNLTLNLFGGADNIFGSTYYSLLFVGPNITGLAQPADGGTGDGYILPAPYKATGYVNATLEFGL